MHENIFKHLFLSKVIALLMLNLINLEKISLIYLYQLIIHHY